MRRRQLPETNLGREWPANLNLATASCNLAGCAIHYAVTSRRAKIVPATAAATAT